MKKLSRKVVSGIGALKRIRPYVTLPTMQLIYNCLVQPYFDYCSVIWDSCGSNLADKLQKLQNRAARVLTSSRHDSNADYLFERLGWIKLSSQPRISKAIMVYKCLFVDRSSITNYALRETSDKLALPLPRTNYLKKALVIAVQYCGTHFPTC